MVMWVVYQCADCYANGRRRKKLLFLNSWWATEENKNKKMEREETQRKSYASNGYFVVNFFQIFLILCWVLFSF